MYLEVLARTYCTVRRSALARTYCTVEVAAYCLFMSVPASALKLVENFVVAGRGECIFGTAKDSMQAATTTIEALKLSSATWVEALAAVHEELETEEMALATITESKMDYDDDDFDPNG
jgi:hypothetical protein